MAEVRTPTRYRESDLVRFMELRMADRVMLQHTQTAIDRRKDANGKVADEFLVEILGTVTVADDFRKAWSSDPRVRNEQ